MASAVKRARATSGVSALFPPEHPPPMVLQLKSEAPKRSLLSGLGGPAKREVCPFLKKNLNASKLSITRASTYNSQVPGISFIGSAFEG